MNHIRQERILITGARGFTAAYLKELFLKEGFEVWGLVKDFPKEWEVAADLTNKTALDEAIKKVSPHYVVHLAGISLTIYEKSEALYNINCVGTMNLLASLQANNIPVKKIILSSSAYVYGNFATQNSVNLISENICPKPNNHYSMSKLSMEYMALGLYPNLPIVIVRPFNYTGVGQKNDMIVPKILHHFLIKSPTISLGNTHIYREFNDVRMAAAAYKSLLLNAIPGTTVNICSGRSHSLQNIIDTLSKISNHSLNIVVDLKLVRKNETVTLAGDPTLLKSLVSNLPEYSLEDTLRWMYDSSSHLYVS